MAYIRFASFLILGYAALTLPLAVFLIGACMYALVYRGYELLCIGVCIDALFGYGGHAFPYLYTSGILVILAVVLCARPYLRVYA